MKVLECKNISKVYEAFKGASSVKAINDISFVVNKGEFLGIMGPSGSGKTTLLNVLAGIDKLTCGEIILKDMDISKLKKDEMAVFRRNNIGFIFQDFNLLDSLTVKENIAFPLIVDKVNPREVEKKTEELINKELLKLAGEELNNKDKKRIKSVFPAKMYVNTIKQVFDKFNIPAAYKFKEQEDCIQITVNIPKNNK